MSYQVVDMFGRASWVLSFVLHANNQVNRLVIKYKMQVKKKPLQNPFDLNKMAIEIDGAGNAYQCEKD